MPPPNAVTIIPPTEGFLAIAEKYANDIRQVVEAQTSSDALHLPHICKEVEKEFTDSHHEKTERDYSIDGLPVYKTNTYLFNKGRYTPIYAGFVVPVIPLFIVGDVTARITFSNQPAILVQLQRGLMMCIAGADGVYLDIVGDGKVVWVFLFYEAKKLDVGGGSTTREVGQNPVI
ncbi:MAG: hypothetical protein M1839_000869 [Geoglossum umbratile]|nr:MAG: hypothetical protein M1839_000869 [Geoglossum umbratile]